MLNVIQVNVLLFLLGLAPATVTENPDSTYSAPAVQTVDSVESEATFDEEDKQVNDQGVCEPEDFPEVCAS